MGTLTSGIFISLDGVYQAPGGSEEDREGGFEHGGWTAPLADPDVGAWIAAATLRPDALLLGRKTYEIFANFWPTADASPISDKLNQVPKYVASRTMDQASWTGTTVLDGDVVDAVTKLKDDHRLVATIGSGELVKTLLQARVVDELQLLVHPVIIGTGKRFYGEGTRSAPGTWRLAHTTTFASGTMANVYRPAGPLETGEVA